MERFLLSSLTDKFPRKGFHGQLILWQIQVECSLSWVNITFRAKKSQKSEKFCYYLKKWFYNWKRQKLTFCSGYFFWNFRKKVGWKFDKFSSSASFLKKVLYCIQFSANFWSGCYLKKHEVGKNRKFRGLLEISFIFHYDFYVTQLYLWQLASLESNCYRQTILQ